MDNSKITIQTTVHTDIAKAWLYWTSPEHLIHWNFASNDWHCPNASNDLRTGGKFSATMAARDGSMSFDFAGVYDEVIEQQRIAYSLGDERKVEVLFHGDSGATTITETFDPEHQNPVEMQRAGWQAILDNYKKYVESN